MNKTALDPFRLPPLILHPFASAEENVALLESSRASLALQGFMSKGDASPELLDSRLLRGRYAELCMLFYIGKDVSRWTEQCAETAAMNSRFRGRAIRPETFAVLLVTQIPAHVRIKLESWGVLDYCSLFRRSFGLHAVIGDLPVRESLSPDFLRFYHRYLDQWYEQRLQDYVFDRPAIGEFAFDLFASGEYSDMLAESWSTEISAVGEQK